MPAPAGPIGARSHMPGGGGAARRPPSFPPSVPPAPPSPSRASPSAGLSAGSGRDRTMSTLKVYSTSVTGSREIKSQQSEVTRILDGKNIKYELVDISQDNALREEMRAKAGNPKAIPPQIVNGDQYCGDYELFVEAVEQNTLQEFLKLA
ncbi:LOW QUALITY PROTEIN: SH3 domain-binding glutamic acid-rich-like protein 3 [Myiozetetes cayanensis]|uniref:LOW QUALITY PROTEIN: SH3 domain-binding glutamic acid-rich-like protein 3 n=1 Tax=Myiozetetes cayanensis TaxID=478635 RepID=UPI002160FF09|nr:LOW QUALITY PROTEIN: SH3 domain-binding glutamic acid-rich-like protein 3 [Myiozetetes cayanensis]